MENNISIQKIEKVLEHIKRVRDNCNFLGLKIIDNGNVQFGLNLIANGQIHDNSKFKGIEFERLVDGDSFLPEVIKHHRLTNPHHPEYWGGIHNMPEIFLAEMVCDCSARSSECGESIRDWFATDGARKYNFLMDDEVGQKITGYLNLLFPPLFKDRIDKRDTI